MVHQNHLRRGVVRVLDREGNLELTRLDLQLVEGLVVEVGIEELEARKLGLELIVQLRGEITGQRKAYTTQTERRLVAVVGVATHHITRNLGQGLRNLIPGRTLLLERIDLLGKRGNLCLHLLLRHGLSLHTKGADKEKCE